MLNKLNINHLANCIAGYTFRCPILGLKDGHLYVLQAKNINGNILIADAELTRTSFQTSHTKAFVETGDVAIGSRGVFKAGVIESDKQILASSSVFLLRVKDKTTVLPEYLAIYLNSIPGQKNLHQFLTNGTIRTLLKKDLENIKIPIPPIEQQKQIVRLDQNVKQQMKLLNRKIKAQANIVNGILNQLERSQS